MQKQFYSIGFGVALVMHLGCASTTTEPEVSAARMRARTGWIFASPEGNAYSSEDAKGRVSVLLFFTTYDPASQIAVSRFDSVLHQLKRRINAYGVALEPPNHALLVGVFRDSLHVTFPLLLPDPGTLEGQGPFGAIDSVPTWVVLDEFGREIWRKSGVSVLDELRGVLLKLGDATEH